jgi:hypothetical protein
VDGAATAAAAGGFGGAGGSTTATAELEPDPSAGRGIAAEVVAVDPVDPVAPVGPVDPVDPAARPGPVGAVVVPEADADAIAAIGIGRLDVDFHAVTATVTSPQASKTASKRRVCDGGNNGSDPSSCVNPRPVEHARRRPLRCLSIISYRVIKDATGCLSGSA